MELCLEDTQLWESSDPRPQQCVGAVQEVAFLGTAEFLHVTLYPHMESQPSFFRVQLLLIA